MFTHKKILSAIAVAIVCGIFVCNSSARDLIITKALAQSATNPNQQANDAFLLLSFVSSVFFTLTMYVVHILEFLLDPNTFLQIAYFNDALHMIWRLSRDIVNIVLAVMLIGGAVYTIIMAKTDVVMGLLPKFIMAMILVNFSWFFPRVILDISHVLTVSVYTIPSYINNNSPTMTCKRRNPDTNAMEACTIWSKVEFGVEPAEIQSWKSKGYKCANMGSSPVCYKEVPLASSANTPQAILLGLVFNHGRIMELTKVRNPNNNSPPMGGGGANSNQTQKLFIVLFNTAFAFILMMALFLPLLAMVIAFTIRIPMLWITIAFMPFMFLGFVLGDKMKIGNQSLNSMVVFQKFVASAFLPFALAIPLSAGFILLNAASYIAENSTKFPAHQYMQNMPISGVATFLDLLWLIMTFMVFWVGTFTAFKIDEVYSKVSEPIRQWGEGVGQGIAKLPLRTPFIPIGGGKSAAPWSMIAGVPAGIEAYGQDLEKGQAGGLDKYFGSGAGSGGSAAQINNMKTNITATTNAPVKASIQNNIRAINGDLDNQTKINALHEAIKNDNTSGNAAFTKFDAQMKKLQGDVGTLGGGDLSFEKMQEAASLTRQTISNDMEALVNEWINEHG